MAEISVPAWPMPIHQTKLTIAKPQPTGTLMPQMPTPLNSNMPMVFRSTITRMNASPKPTSHFRLVGRVSTMALILSVTLP